MVCDHFLTVVRYLTASPGLPPPVRFLVLRPGFYTGLPPLSHTHTAAFFQEGAAPLFTRHPCAMHEATSYPGIVSVLFQSLMTGPQIKQRTWRAFAQICQAASTRFTFYVESHTDRVDLLYGPASLIVNRPFYLNGQRKPNRTGAFGIRRITMRAPRT